MNYQRWKRHFIIVSSAAFDDEIRADVDKGEHHANRGEYRMMLFLLTLLILIVFYTAADTLIQRYQGKAGQEQEALELRDALEKAEAEKAQLIQENKTLSDEIANARNLAWESIEIAHGQNHEVIKEYQNVARIAGITALKGNGLRVTLRDKEGIAYDRTTPITEIVHDADIRYFVDWFKSHDAIAIQVNGERLSPMSPLLCLGPSVLVNRVFQSSPFVVEACVENPDVFSQLQQSEVVKKMLERGLRIDIESVPEIQINALEDSAYIKEQVLKLGGSYEE